MSEKLSSDEIKQIRNRYGLSQRAFARVLGIGEASIVRYENGVEPTRANDNLIRAARNPSFMLDCLQRDGDLISPDQRQRTEAIVYAEVTFDEKGEIMGMNEIYEITLQQEVLNEKAANMLGELSRLRREAQERGDEVRAMVYEDVFNQISLAKHDIIREEYSTEAKIAELRGRIDGLYKFACIVDRKAA